VIVMDAAATCVTQKVGWRRRK